MLNLDKKSSNKKKVIFKIFKLMARKLEIFKKKTLIKQQSSKKQQLNMIRLSQI